MLILASLVGGYVVEKDHHKWAYREKEKHETATDHMIA